MKKASWIVVLLVGLLIGVTADRMLGGGGTPRPAPHAAPAPAPAAPPVEDPRAVYRVPVDDTPLRGPADALVTIVVASDFQCPFCKRVEPTLQAMADAFPGKVRFGWKHQPLPGHARALPAAIAVEEARAQGGDAKFWAMHDKLFELAPALERPDLERAAREVGLDVAAVGAALDQNKHAERIRRDQALCQSLGVRATPTLFVNGRKIEGALPPEQLKPIVQQELDKAQALVASGVKPQDVYAKIMEKGATSVVYQGGAAPRPAAPAAAQATPPTPSTVAVPVPLRVDDPSRGPTGAKLTVVLFSDFQCPFCARVEPTVKQMEEAYPGAVRVVWKHQPLPATMHPQARPAAEAAEAARVQGKFWEMHDQLFAHQRELSADLYPRLARELGLDVARFERDLAAHAGGARIDEDQRVAGQVGANATPTFFVNCRRVEGAYPFDSLKPILAEEARKADALLAKGTPAAGLHEALCKENVRAFPAPAAGAAAQNAVLPGGRAAVPVRGDDPVKGPATAAVTVVEFSDFQCPFCGRAIPAVKDVEAAFPRDVRIVWKHLPLSFHQNAMPAALAAEAAREQGGPAKFWAMHDKLFANQAALSEATYEQYARELGLDLARFKKDVADPKLKARVQEDAQLAQRVGVNGTPTFIVNGETVVGSAALRPAIERQLQAAKPVRAAAR